MAHKLETLAKLYLEGESVEISDIAQQKLCDWLMGEFQQLPINPLKNPNQICSLEFSKSQLEIAP